MLSHLVSALLVLTPIQSVHEDSPLSVAPTSIVGEAMVPDAARAPELPCVTPGPHPLPMWPGLCPPPRPRPWPRRPQPSPFPDLPRVFDRPDQVPSALPSGIY